jgi:hypothetical protein
MRIPQWKMSRRKRIESESKLMVSLMIFNSFAFSLHVQSLYHQRVLVSTFHVPSSSSHYGSGRASAIMDHRAINNNNHRQVTWLLQAKRRKRDSQDESDDVFSNWYERVDKSATPDNVFWSEMARQQRAIAAEQQQSSGKSVSEEGTSSNPIITNGSYSPSSTSSAGGGRNPSSAATPNPEAVLQSFAYAARSNNFLADMIGGTANEYTWDYSTDDEDEEEENEDDILKTINEQEEAEMELQRQRLDEELDYLLSLPVEEMQGDRDDSDEIWDIWANRDQEQCKFQLYVITSPILVGCYYYYQKCLPYFIFVILPLLFILIFTTTP